MKSRIPAITVATVSLVLLVGAALMAPEHLSAPDLSAGYAQPSELPPFGADARGRPLLEYAMHGAQVVAVPAILSGVLVTVLATAGGLLRCGVSDALKVFAFTTAQHVEQMARAIGLPESMARVLGRYAGSVLMPLTLIETYIQALSEIVGALPRMVVILVVALVLPQDARGLLPLGITWAILSAPGAMDEAASVAERLGGSRFVEALRAHGYTNARIYGYHVVGLNLRPVVVRQGAECLMQVTFLEIALSYLALAEDQPSFTHSDSLKSWADLLKDGYPALVFDVPTMHSLVLGVALVALVMVMSVSIGRAVRER